MNCQEALSLLYDVIDKEASEIDAQQVAEHLRRCHDCAGKYQLEQSIHELIQARLKSKDVTPEVTALKSKVLTQLDQVDRGNQPRMISGRQTADDTPPTSFRLGRALAIAASVIVVVTAGYFGLRAFDDHAFYVPLEQAHWNATEQVSSYNGSVPTTLARTEMRERFDYDIEPAVNEFGLIGGRLEQVDGYDVAHFVYCNHARDKVVSVFVIEADLMTLPDDLVATVVSQNGIDFYDHNCRGCRLVYHRAGNALIVTATTVSSLDLIDFVPDRSPV